LNWGVRPTEDAEVFCGIVPERSICVCIYVIRDCYKLLNIDVVFSKENSICGYKIVANKLALRANRWERDFKLT